MRWLLLLFISTAFAQPAGIDQCTGCHGPEGEGKGFPRIAGQPAPYLARQLEAYADGRRKHEIMTPIAKALSAEQRAQYAAYFSDARVPDVKSATGKPSARGRTLAVRGDEASRVQACQNCHGPGGTGLGPFGPYLAGLDGKYLQGALMTFKEGARKTEPSGAMAVIAGNLTQRDIGAVASHYAAQDAPKAPAKKADGDKKKAPPPTKAGTGKKPPAGQGAGGGAATTGGSQGPGGDEPAPTDAPQK